MNLNFHRSCFGGDLLWASIMEFRCLLFDLDGTLVDSRADLALSVNLTLAALGLKTLESRFIVSLVGEGVTRLIERALSASQGHGPSANELSGALDIFDGQYAEHLLDHTRPYPGVEYILDRFSGIPKAVVTNKPLRFTDTILSGLNLSSHFQTIYGGNSFPERKPSPLPLLEAVRECRAEPGQSLMIGDSNIDILAGRAAGIRTCGFVEGFRGRDELVAAGADWLFEDFRELEAIVENGVWNYR
jgi:phosphoglycolate phosphatase